MKFFKLFSENNLSPEKWISKYIKDGDTSVKYRNGETLIQLNGDTKIKNCQNFPYKLLFNPSMIEENGMYNITFINCEFKISDFILSKKLSRGNYGNLGFTDIFLKECKVLFDKNIFIKDKVIIEACEIEKIENIRTESLLIERSLVKKISLKNSILDYLLIDNSEIENVENFSLLHDKGIRFNLNGDKKFIDSIIKNWKSKSFFESLDFVYKNKEYTKILEDNLKFETISLENIKIKSFLNTNVFAEEIFISSSEIDSLEGFPEEKELNIRNCKINSILHIQENIYFLDEKTRFANSDEETIMNNHKLLEKFLKMNLKERFNFLNSTEGKDSIRKEKAKKKFNL